MSYASILREVADLIAEHLDGSALPPPTSITLGGRFVPPGTVQVRVDRADLSPWLAALGLDEPAWHGDSEAGLMFALWPPNSFEGKPFQLVCIKDEAGCALMNGERIRIPAAEVKAKWFSADSVGMIHDHQTQEVVVQMSDGSEYACSFNEQATLEASS